MRSSDIPPSHDQQDRVYWLGLLSKDLTRSSLLLDYKRPTSFAPRTKRVRIDVNHKTTSRLNRLVHGSPILLTAALVAAIATALRRHGAATRALIGTPALQEQERTNAVVVAVEVDGTIAFRELLAAVRDGLLAGYRHQNYPIEKLAEDLDVPPKSSRCPFFDILVCIDGLHGEAPELQHDLTVGVTQNEERIRLCFDYSVALFDTFTIECFARQVTRTLQQGLNDITTPLSDLTGIDEAGESRLVELGKGPHTGLPAHAAVHQLFEEQVSKNPEAVALRSPDKILTYGELDWRAENIAKRLAGLGVGPETLVGLCMERSPEFIAGALGIHKAGGAYLPLDPAYPKQRLAFMLEDARPRVLLTQEHLLNGGLPVSDSETVVVEECWDTSEIGDVDAPVVESWRQNLAYCMYTSGSTGRPKGVLIEHRGLLNRVVSSQAVSPLSHADRVIQATSICFDVSALEIFSALVAGAELIIAPPGAYEDLELLVDTVVQHRVTVIHLVPTVLELLLAHERFVQCDSLRLVFCAGEPLPITVAKRACSHGDTRLINNYGPTEASIDATSSFYEHGLHPRFAPLGMPLQNTHIYILDELQRLVPQGAPGELYIGGIGVGRGYLNRPALTAEQFLPNPFVQNDGSARFYRSGDLARFKGNGQLEFLGRTDDQIKLHGQRIELKEIESVLAELAEVRQCRVVLREVQSGKRGLVAYVVGREGLSAFVLRTSLAEKLPGAMIPSTFVFLKAMPLLPNGKVDRAALPPPGSDRPEVSSPFVAPRNASEKLLTTIWQEVLQIEQVGVDDNFFELGGDSILTLLVASRASKAGLHVTPRQVYDHQTVAAIASELAAAPGGLAPQGPVEGVVPLTPIQHWFFHQERQDRHHFNQAFLLRVRPLDPAALEQALATVVAHHDTLRHRFYRCSSGFEQMGLGLLEQDTPLLEIVDLSNLTPTEAKKDLEQNTAATQHRLNLEQGPLLRALLFRLPRSYAGTEDDAASGGLYRDRLFLAVHHLVVDGISWRILLEDIEAAYDDSLQDRQCTLPPKTTSYSEWAQRLLEHAPSLESGEQVDYWLRSVRKTTPLPLDFPAALARNDHSSREELNLELDGETSGLLLQATGRNRAVRTVDLLVTALARCLSAWTGDSTVQLDLEAHGREELFDGVDLSRTVGWFTAIYPIWLSLTSGTGPVEHVGAVQNRLRQIPHGGVGFGVLTYLGSDAAKQSMATMPKADVLFNFLGGLDQIVPHGAMLQVAPEHIGETEGRQGMRTHVLEINSLLAGNQIRVSWRYSGNLHRRETIQRLAAAYFDEIKTISQACIDRREHNPAPDDFPQAGLGQGDLDKVMARARARLRREQQ